MNIYRQELAMRIRSVAVWSAAVAAVLFVFNSLFASFAKQAAAINEAMSNFPPQLLTAFGLTGVDLSTVAGFFGYVFLFVQICLAIQASNEGFSLVSVEERERTADFLLTKPVTRRRVLVSKLLASLTGLCITNAVVWIASLVSLGLFAGESVYSVSPVLLPLAGVIVFQIFFLSVGLAVSVLLKKVRNVVPYSMGLTFGMYVLNVFGQLLGTSVLEKITPFKHFDPYYIIQNGTYNWPLVLVSVVIVLVSLVVGYAVYTRKDIPAPV